jgi:hypothetical protein
MALIRFGSGVVQMSGSIAGDTYARNRFGNYNRARTKPVNPQSERQEKARATVMMLAEQWRESPMTDDIRTAWGVYANSVTWFNKLGEIIKLTGFNMFVRNNAALLAAGGSLVTAAPTDLGLPPGDPTFAVAGSADGKKLSVTFDEDFDWVEEEGAYMSIEMGLPQNASRNFFGGPWRFAGAIAGSKTSAPESPTEIDPAWVLTAGQRIWCRARIIRADSRCSTQFNSAPFVAGA